MQIYWSHPYINSYTIPKLLKQIYIGSYPSTQQSSSSIERLFQAPDKYSDIETVKDNGSILPSETSSQSIQKSTKKNNKKSNILKKATVELLKEIQKPEKQPTLHPSRAIHAMFSKPYGKDVKGKQMDSDLVERLEKSYNHPEYGRQLALLISNHRWVPGRHHQYAQQHGLSGVKYNPLAVDGYLHHHLHMLIYRLEI